MLIDGKPVDGMLSYRSIQRSRQWIGPILLADCGRAYAGADGAGSVPDSAEGNRVGLLSV